MSDLSYDDFKNRLSIQEVLIDAGYTHYRRDGLRYPSYVRLDSNGHKIPGDKFLVTANGLCCFKPPVIRNYNVISFIKEHPDLFSDYTPGMDKDRLVNLVCNRLLNEPVDVRESKIINMKQDKQTFDIGDYTLTQFRGGTDGNFRMFYPYFAQRGIDLPTQTAFRNGFVIASIQGNNGKTYSNLSFPMRIPDKEGIVGLEQRGLKMNDGTSYKGMARGSNASEGMWISSPNNTRLSDTKHVFVFESGYDAMAFFQLHTGKDSQHDNTVKEDLKSAVYVSTGGSPSYGQMSGLIKSAPNATFHLGFDNDIAGRQFVMNFRDIAYKSSPVHPDNVSAEMRPFIETFKGIIESTDMLCQINDERYDALPKDLKTLYVKYDTAREEALEAKQSPFLCKEDKEEALDKMHDAFVNFRTALLDKLNVREGQYLGGVRIVREEPSEGYKDFNDELLGRNGHPPVGQTVRKTHEVEENEKVFSSFENSAKSIAEYLKNIHEKYMETVKSVNVNTVVAEVTIGNVTKGFENIDEAWAAANNSKAKSFEIKIKKDITADAKTGFNLSKLDTKNGFNGQGGFKVAKGKTASVDLGGHRIFIDYSTKKDDKGSKMAVFELDGDLSMKNGTIEGGMNAVRVNGSSKVDLDNVKIYRTKGPSLYFLGKNEKLKMTNCTIKYAQNGTDHECCYGPDRDIFYGSAIHADVWGRGDYEIRNCLFEKNTGDMGGALSLPAYNGRVVIENCRFIGNRSRSAGSAIDGGAGIMTINGCLFRDNITATKIECKKNVVVNSRGSRGETHKETDCSYINNRQVDSIPVLDYKFCSSMLICR